MEDMRNMTKTLAEIAKLVDGELIAENPELEISGVNGLIEAVEGEITFAVPPHIEASVASRATAMILPMDVLDYTAKPVIKVKNPRAAFAQLLEVFRAPDEVERVISERASIAKSAKIGKNVAIMDFAVVADNAEIGDGVVLYPNTYIGKNVKIGENTTVYPSAVIREDCVLGKRVIIQSGAVIGGDGFGFITEGGKHTKVLQVGNVVIGDDVEVGNNTCIDRATAGSTIVKKGTKIDNLVHLGHNDVIGENCLLVAQTGISGSVEVGHNVTFAGQSGTIGHIKITDNCVFAARAGVTNNITESKMYSGFPCRPHKEWLKGEASLRKVTDLVKKVKELEKAMAKLTTKK
jgi:UDP-3-O-[3-hydroxymyristoyl] glucosamine N-acyltransferase